MITAMLSKLLLLVFARSGLTDEVAPSEDVDPEPPSYRGPRGPHDESPARGFTVHSVESFYGLGNP